MVDQRNVVDDDGLIGMDVFSRFLVTLDYPMRKLFWHHYPAVRTTTGPAKPTLETAAMRMMTIHLRRRSRRLN